MEIPHHQQQLDELTAEEIVDDKYVITFSSYLLLVKRCNDVNTDCWLAAIAVARLRSQV